MGFRYMYGIEFPRISKSVLYYEMAANAAIDDVEENALNRASPHRLKHTSGADEAQADSDFVDYLMRLQ